MSTASKNHTIEVSGHNFTLRTKDPDRLKIAAKLINKKIDGLSAKHPLLPLKEIYLLALVELAFEQTEVYENGKALLKETNQLIEWMDSQIG